MTGTNPAYSGRSERVVRAGRVRGHRAVRGRGQLSGPTTRGSTAVSGASRQRAFLCLYSEPWETPLRTSKHHLMRHFARTSRVLYVEMPAHPAMALAGDGRLRRALRRTAAGPREVGDNIFVLSPVVPLPYHARAPLFSGLWANRLKQRVAFRSIRRALARLGMER